jgi:hypothetical protein
LVGAGRCCGHQSFIPFIVDSSPGLLTGS